MQIGAKKDCTNNVAKDLTRNNKEKIIVDVAENIKQSEVSEEEGTSH